MRAATAMLRDAMPGFIGEDQVRKVREATDLVQLMGEYTNLRRAGANHTGCCPFHQERTPSMYVYDDGHYHCYGCGAHGDAITLIREKERVEFTDAVELLARRAGIELAYEQRGQAGLPRGERDRLLALMEMAAAFYERQLWETPAGAAAREYLSRRGIGEQLARRFRLGWAPGRGQLVEFARRKGADAEELARLDLAAERQGRWTDRFFERVTFPICDRFGNPIAFTARLLPEAERRAKEEGRGVGKYVNSTDTPLFHKSNAVFNLHRAKHPAKDKGRLIVMEGPTDVMAAEDAGFGECVAVLGTAFTPEHARQMGSLSADGRLVLLFDGDAAGQSKTLTAIRVCLAAGVPSWVAVVPAGLDPSELLKEEAGAGGAVAFQSVLDQARTDVDHLLRAIAPRPFELDARQRLAALDDLLAALRPIKDRDLLASYLEQAAIWFNLDRAAVDRRLQGTPADAAAAPATSASELPPLQPSHDAVLHILVRRPDLRAVAGDELGLEPSHFPEAWRPLVDRLLLAGEVDEAALSVALEDPGLAPLRPVVGAWLVRGLEERVPKIGDPEAVLRQLAAELRLGWLKAEFHRLRIATDEAVRARDMALAGSLSREREAVAHQLRDLGFRPGTNGR